VKQVLALAIILPIACAILLKECAMRAAMQARRHTCRAAAGLVLAAVSMPASSAAQTPSAPSRPPDVIFVPTPMEVVSQMLALARVSKDDVVYDLGCGDGRLVITAAKRFGARGVGIDIDPVRVADSRRNADTAGVTERVRFYERDLFESDLREASVVTLYLTPDLNVKLRPKLFAELRPGTRIVSYSFNMGDWEPDSTASVYLGTLHYWVLPATVAGTWTVSAASGGSARRGAERRYAVRFTQRYQRLTGTATAEGRAVPLAGARLIGEWVTFTLTDTVGGRSVAMRFAGRVSGGTMSGMTTVGGTGERHAWRAVRVPSESVYRRSR
jgi:SAM-dependent methyltransferase